MNQCNLTSISTENNERKTERKKTKTAKKERKRKRKIAGFV